MPNESLLLRVHRHYHVITMYNPHIPFTRLHVPIREECCEIGRVLFRCASGLLLPLSSAVYSHLLLPLR